MVYSQHLHALAAGGVAQRRRCGARRQHERCLERGPIQRGLSKARPDRVSSRPAWDPACSSGRLHVTVVVPRALRLDCRVRHEPAARTALRAPDRQEANTGSADLQIGGCRVRRAASHRWTQLAKGVRPWSGHVPMPPTAQSPAAKDLVGAQ
eukprot:scaffold79928_cov54-Phaeocystis_antarctica.AAC.2